MLLERVENRRVVAFQLVLGDPSYIRRGRLYPFTSALAVTGDGIYLSTCYSIMTITIASTTSVLRKEGKGAENLSLSRHEEDHMTGNRCVKSAFIGHETSLSLSIPFPVFLTGIYL